jgi:hypothetical protein
VITEGGELLRLLMLLPKSLYSRQGRGLTILKGGQESFKAKEALSSVCHVCKSFWLMAWSLSKRLGNPRARNDGHNAAPYQIPATPRSLVSVTSAMARPQIRQRGGLIAKEVGLLAAVRNRLEAGPR